MSISGEALQSISPQQRHELLARLRRSAVPTAAATTSRIERRTPGSQPLPVSSGQAGLWFLNRIEGGANYNEFIALRIDGLLDVAALCRALSELVHRHEALRTVFPEIDGTPVQTIVTERSFAPDIIALNGLAEAEIECEIAARVDAEARRPFDLCDATAFRATLLRFAPARHVLMLSMHHIICDRWSADMLARELAVCFAAFAAGEAAPLHDLPLQSADFATWQHARIASGAVDRQLAHWRERLANAPGPLAWPTGARRFDALTCDGARVSVRLSGRLTTAIKAVARQCGTTPFVALYASFSLLLAKLSGERDIIIGTPVANRDKPELRNVMGFLVNMLPLRLRLTEGMTGRQLLEAARSVALDALANQEVPIERLADELGSRRSPQHAPLFQVTFALQSEPAEALRLEGLTVSPVETSFTAAKFDLSLFLQEREGSFLGYLEYRTDLFDQETVQAISDRLLCLTDALITSPDSDIETASLLLPGERERLWQWGHNPREYPRDAAIGELFAGEAAARPGSVALVSDGEVVSYGELEARSNRLAQYLLGRLGPLEEAAVGLLVDRSSDLIVAMLGVLKAGAAYLPLDVGAPSQRLGFMLSDGEAVAVLSTSALAAALPAGSAPVILLDREAPSIATCPATPPASGASGASLAYVMYTSGSTGRPKGVCVPHRAVVRLVRNTDYVTIGPGDRIAHGSNVAFDAATFEVFGALLNGATVDVLTRAELLNLEVLARQVRARRFNILFLTTALFNRLSDLDAGMFAALDYLLFGGEAVDERRVAAVVAAGAPRHLLHVYGPTESTTFATWHPVAEQDALDSTIPIGRPIWNTRVYVLDEWLEPSPIGVMGELYIGGDGLARGYVGQAGLTAERFVADRFGPPGGRLYRSGDYVRWRFDGQLEFIGRRDAQEKLRGYRIERGEIESVLRQDGSVSDAAVVVRGVGDARALVAYVVPRGTAALEVASVRGRLRAVLPDYMVPARFVVLDHLPLTANGKLDRSRLPEPAALAAEGMEGSAGGWLSPTEAVLAGLWSAVLGRDGIGRTDNFFDLGGHSLVATQLIARIRDSFAVEVALAVVFEQPVLSEQAAELERSRGGVTLPAIAPRPAGVAVPLSFAQQRLWFLAQLQEQEAAASYNIAAALRLEGSLDVSALRGALRALTARQESLRMTIRSEEGSPQIVLGEPYDPLEEADLSGLAAPAQEMAVQQRATAHGGAGFDLARDRLLRLCLLRLGSRSSVLLFSMHHIIGDAWSLEILVRELGALYAAACRGEAPELPPLAIQYGDYALWQRGWLSGATLERQLAYWRGALAGAPALLELPLDHARPAVKSYRGARVEQRIDAALADRLRALGRRYGTTLYMTLLAGFKVLLYRLSGSGDVVVGSPIANRRHSSTEGVIGFFVNTLVLRSRLAGEMLFSAVLGEVQRTALAAYAHQDVPFEALVSELSVERSLSHSPLFQVMFALQSAPEAEVRLGEVTVQALEQPTRSAKFDLFLEMSVQGEELVGVWEYSTDLFEASTVARMAEQYATLLEGMVSDADLAIGRLALLSASERCRLERFNATAREYPRDAAIGELFAGEAAARPGSVALVSDGEVVSYGELEARSNRLAQYLLGRLGPLEEAVVGLLVDRSSDLIVAMLGVLKAGAAYLPLDVGAPSQRLGFMLSDGEAVAVLSTSALAAALPAGSAPVILLDREAPSIATCPATPPASGASGASLAYVMYTSGSTGRPKGVCVPHRAVVRLVRNTDYARFSVAEVFLQNAPVSFDAATFEIWGALLNGARLVLMPPGQTSLEALGRCIAAHGVSTLWLTASLFNLMIDEHPTALRGLRQLLVGGEALSVPHIHRARAALPDCQLINGYGPTECTTFSCCYSIAGTEASGSIPIGGPIANTTAHVLDEHGELLPIGIAGELYIGGDGLARGYLGQPALTAERFLELPGLGRLYRTGDIARWHADGTLEFLGRRDDQIKLRGFRIEPAEIEAALLTHPNLAQAAVVLHGEGKHRHLVAYLRYDGAPGEAVAEHLRRLLPSYMVPARFVVLDEFPLTVSGKIDRRALPAPGMVSNSTPAQTLTPTEDVLAVLWCRLLRRDAIGPNDSFFELGGHSLLATQLVSRIRDAFHVELPLTTIFTSQTLRELAARIDSLSHRPELGSAIPSADRAQLLPLSFAQERLWFLHKLEPANPFYNTPLTLRLRGPLDTSALQAGLQDLVERHEILRTAFVERDGQPHQVIVADLQPRLVNADLSHLSEPEREPTLLAMARIEAQTPFADLGAPPLMRAILVKLGHDHHALLLTFHHIVTDGWSLGVLGHDLAAFYNARRDGSTAALPSLPIQYADYAIWQRGWLKGEILDTQLEYWRRQLTAAPTSIDLPTDHPRPPVQRFRGASIQFTVARSTRDTLHRVGRDLNATLFMTLLAGFASLLYRYSGQCDMVFGSPIAGRNRAETERLIGFFVNTLALRVDLRDRPRFSDLVARVQRMALDAYAHQELPFERLVDELQPERDLSRSPLFQVMFALQNTPAEWATFSALAVDTIPIERTSALFDLVLDAWDLDDGLHCVLEYNRELFEATTAARLVKHLCMLLEAFAADPETEIDTPVLLDTAERAHILSLSNGPRVEHPVDQPLTLVFETQVARDPYRTAVVAHGKSLDYGKLNQQANRLAHLLRSLGVTPNARVGVLVPRGLEYLVAVTGIIKAGGAFLPLDTAYPSDRLKYMVHDSAITVLVATAQDSTTLLAGAPPPTLTDIILIDTAPSAATEPGSAIRLHHAAELDRQPHDNPCPVNAAHDVLYMIYTSGSTGLPKGALVRHDGALNHIFAESRLLRFDSRSAFLQSAPVSSDISVWQCLAPLLTGGRVVVAGFDTVCNPAALFALIRDEQATVIELVPTVLEALIDHAASLPAADRPLAALEWAMVTGESASVALVNRWFDVWPNIPLINAYGPTEAADDVCQHVMRRPLDRHETNVPIGAPIDNLSVLVLDQRSALIPLGMRGEICVAGIGVGAGYWQQPQRTAEVFVDNPHKDATFGAVLYRTGDIGRWRDDGTLEFLGRMDNQVKIRGFRVELGEIEAALTARQDIREAVVVDHLDRHDERRLAAYVQVRSNMIDRVAFAAEQLQLWQELHDDSYGDTSILDRDPAFNTVGWDSTYTGEPLSETEMRECVDNAVSRILALQPRHLLEIGCGSGLLLYRLVPHCLSYLGTDLSARAIEQLRAVRSRLTMPGLERAELRTQRADDFSAIAPGSFDTLVLNSVVQYFPSVDYLLAVLTEAVNRCASGGSIFIGDVRSVTLLRSYYRSVQWYKAEPEITQVEFNRRVEAQFTREQELAIAAGFFHALMQHLPRLSSLAILPKRGLIHNEMTRFRYDVVLRVEAGNNPIACPPEAWEDWRNAIPAASAIGQRLAFERPNYFGLRHVANARLDWERRIGGWLADDLGAATVGEVRHGLELAQADGLDPEALWHLAQTTSYDVDIRCEPESGDGDFAVLFRRRDSVPVDIDAILATAPRPFADYANNPLYEKVARALVPELQRHLKESLPQHMIPASFVVLDRFPLLPNGKIDRRALPPPDFETLHRDGYVAPRTRTERVVQTVWAAVLGVEKPGIRANFFAIGGHSLKVTQVVSRIAQELNKAVSLRDFFGHPTVAELAALLDEAEVGDADVPIPATAEAPDYPASPAQQRLWVLAQMEGAAAYHMADSLLLRGDLDVGALTLAYTMMQWRHETLRTEFHEAPGALRQRVRDAVDGTLDVVDLRESPDPIAEARRLALDDARKGFNLARAPLIRLRLVRTGEREHVLQFNMHHIVSDGWSMDILIRETMQLYAAAIEHRADPLPPLRIQYRDYVAWQEARLAPRTQRLRDYWRSQLGDLPPPIDLPVDFPRPPVRSGRGGRVHLRLAPALHTSLIQLAGKQQASMFMLLAALVKVLIYRYSGETDITIGFPIAGREHRDLEGQIGLFANTLVLRSRLDDAQSFAVLLEQIRLTAAAAYEHQDYPLDQLVQDLNPPRDPSRNPLFDIMLVLQNTANESLHLPGLEITSLALDYRLTQFDLLWNFAETSDGLHLDLSYSADRFERGTIAQMLAHWQVMVAAAVARPETPLGRLPLLRAEERAALLEPGPPPAGIALCHQSLVHRFDAQAATTPHAVAVNEGEQRLTYSELNARASALARQLRHRLAPIDADVVPLVGLCLPRSIDLIVAILAILKAGAAYVPVDVDAPAERLRFILSDAGASLLVTRRGVLDESELLPPQYWMDGDALEPEAESICWPVRPDDIAYVIYTSGSTGEPKGVAVSHRNVLRLLTATRPWFSFGANDVWSFFHSVAFDFSVWELWGALLHGGRLVIVPYMTSRDPDRFIDLLEREAVTVLNQTPSAFRQLAHAEALRAQTPALSLRYIIFGGEALDPTELAPWFARHGDANPRLINMYGITETTVHVTYRPLTQADAQRPSSVIGRPIPDLYLYLLDRHLEPVPPGIPGELFVGGDGLAKGYLGRHQLTLERFVADPHRPGQRLYRTGDRARWRHDGELEYLGRFDDQIKLRGFRIEPGEIGYALRQHPAVRDAVVVLRGKGQDALLVAYYVRATGVHEPDLREHLQRCLPMHMVPATYVALPALPLTSNGKLDHRALPDPTSMRPATGQPRRRSARSETEVQVLQVWQSMLGDPTLSLDDNVFDHGAHSVLVVQVRNRLQELVGRDIPVALLFQHPTPADLAAGLDRSDVNDPSDVVETQERASRRRAAAQGRRRATSSFVP